MKITTFFHYLRFTAFTFTFCFLINPAVAQDEGFNSIEEVIVTSQRVEESLQDVPIAVTALTAEMLEDQQIQSEEEQKNIMLQDL